MRNYSVQLVKLSFIIDLEEKLRFVVRSKIVSIKCSVRVLELRSISKFVKVRRSRIWAGIYVVAIGLYQLLLLR